MSKFVEIGLNVLSNSMMVQWLQHDFTRALRGGVLTSVLILNK
jgi:hypothetical protein